MTPVSRSAGGGCRRGLGGFFSSNVSLPLKLVRKRTVSFLNTTYTGLDKKEIISYRHSSITSSAIRGSNSCALSAKRAALTRGATIELSGRSITSVTYTILSSTSLGQYTRIGLTKFFASSAWVSIWLQSFKFATGRSVIQQICKFIIEANDQLSTERIASPTNKVLLEIQLKPLSVEVTYIWKFTALKRSTKLKWLTL